MSLILSNSYDTVVCDQILEHLSQIDVAFGILALILKPGGRFVVGYRFSSTSKFNTQAYYSKTGSDLRASRVSRSQTGIFSILDFARIKTKSKIAGIEGRGLSSNLGWAGAASRKISVGGGS